MNARALLRGLGAACFAATLSAQSAPLLEEIVVTASPHRRPAAAFPGALDLLTGDALRRAASATLGETLAQRPGIANASFGPGVGRPVVRGLAGSRVEILENGLPLADASDTSPDHAVAGEALLLDRIEILRGPATLRYGPGAIGGVVHLIDGRLPDAAPDRPRLALEARGADNGGRRALGGRLDAGRAGFSLHAAGLTRESGNVEIPGTANADGEGPRGRIPNSDAAADLWQFGLAHEGDRLAAGLGFYRLESDYGIPPGAHLHDHHEEGEGKGESADHGAAESAPLARIDLVREVASGHWRWFALPGPLEEWRLDLARSDYRHREVERAPDEIAVGARYARRDDLLRSELLGQWNRWRFALGLQGADTRVAAAGEEAFLPSNEVRQLGLFATLERDWARHSLALGARFDRQRARPEGGGDQVHRLVNASASWLWRLREDQQLGLVLSRAERAPTPEELFADGVHAATRTYQVGDPRLDSELAHGLELTWRREGMLSWSTSLYHRRFAGFIVPAARGARFVPEWREAGLRGLAACSADPAAFHDDEAFAEAQPCYGVLQEDVRMDGLEVELGWHPGGPFSWHLWGDLVRGRFDEGGEVPRLPPARLGGRVESAFDGWGWELSFTHAFDQDRPGRGEAPTAGYSRIDLHLEHRRGPFTLFAAVTNLTDEEIRHATSFLRDLAPEAGRTLEAGVRLEL